MQEYFEKALSIAVEAHKGQVDKSGLPYILHPLAVMSKVNTLELKTIAVLHDTIEDTWVSADYLLENGIPKEIVDVVVLLSKSKDEDYEQYIRKLKYNDKARVVKLADLEHNTDPSRSAGLNEARRQRYQKAKEILKEEEYEYTTTRISASYDYDLGSNSAYTTIVDMKLRDI